MNFISTFGAASALGLVGTLAAAETNSTLTNTQMTSATALIGLGAQDDASADSGMYLLLGVGANMAQDTDVDDVFVTGGSVTSTSISYNVGLDLNVGLGIPIMDQLSVEVMTGLAYNTIDTVSGNFDVLGITGSFTAADGELIQVPIMANLRYDFDLGDSMTLGLFGGAGFQYSDLNISSLTGTTAFGSFSDDFGSGDDFNFRYQFGLNLAWDISNNSSLGIYVRYSGTTGADFGDDFSTGGLGNGSIGASFSLEF